MEEETLEEDGLGDFMKFTCNDDDKVRCTLPNDKHQTTPLVLGDLSCTTKVTKSERLEDDILNSDGNLKFLEERTETNPSKWIESVRKDTRILERWRKEAIFERQLVKGRAFVQCRLLHPHEYLPSGKDDRNGDGFGNPTTCSPLETALCRISKARSDKKQSSGSPVGQKISSDLQNAGFGGAQNEALATYCQQHAYSRARLLRTDRRILANELLGQMATEFGEGTTGKLSPQPADPPRFLTSETSPHRAVAKEADTPIENPDRHTNYPHINHLPRAMHKSKNDDSKQAKESEVRKPGPRTTWTHSTAFEMHESFTVTPCVLFSNHVSSEPWNRCLHRR